MKCRALRALAYYVKVKAKISTQQQVYDEILCVLNLTERYFLFLCATL